MQLANNKKELISLKTLVRSALEEQLGLNKGELNGFENKSMQEKAKLLNPRIAYLEAVLMYLDKYMVLSFIERGKLCDLLNEDDNNFIEVRRRSEDEIMKLRFDEVDKYKKEYLSCSLKAEDSINFVMSALNAMPGEKEETIVEKSKNKFSKLIDIFKKKEKDETVSIAEMDQFTPKDKLESINKFKEVFNYEMLEKDIDELTGVEKDKIAKLVKLMNYGIMEDVAFNFYLCNERLNYENDKVKKIETKHEELENNRLTLVDDFSVWQDTLNNKKHKKYNIDILPNVIASVSSEIEKIKERDLRPVEIELEKVRKEVSTKLKRIYTISVESFIDETVELELYARYQELLSRGEYKVERDDENMMQEFEVVK